MPQFGDELIIESFKIPWLIWIQLLVMVLLVVLLFFGFSLFTSDDSTSSHASSSSSGASTSTGRAAATTTHLNNPSSSHRKSNVWWKTQELGEMPEQVEAWLEKKIKVEKNHHSRVLPFLGFSDIQITLATILG